MKTSPHLLRTACWLAVGAVAFAAPGCSKKAETTPTPPSTSASPPTSTPSASDPAAALKAKADAAKAAVAEGQAGAAAVMDSAPAPVATPPTAAGTAQPDLAGAAALAADQASGNLTALKAQAEQLLTKYSGELTTLKTNLANVKALIDKNANLLPANVTTKYQELNALLPKLNGMVDSLRNVQTADLTNLVPKLQAEFGNAQKLYAEIKAALP
jgi:hypothetical protein